MNGGDESDSYDDNDDDNDDDDDDVDDDHQMRRMVVMMMMIVVLCSLGAVLLHLTVLEFFFLMYLIFNYSYSRNLMKCSNHTPMKISLAFGCPISVTAHP